MIVLPKRGEKNREQDGERHRDESRYDAAGDHLAQGDVRHAEVPQVRGLLQQRRRHRVARNAEQGRGNRVGHVLQTGSCDLLSGSSEKLALRARGITARG